MIPTAEDDDEEGEQIAPKRLLVEMNTSGGGLILNESFSFEEEPRHKKLRTRNSQRPSIGPEIRRKSMLSSNAKQILMNVETTAPRFKEQFKTQEI